MTYTDLNPSATTKQGSPPIWRCDHCHEIVDADTGFIGIAYADIRKLNANEIDEIRWACLHGDCGDANDTEHGLSDEYYYLPIRNVETWEMVGETAALLTKKRWFSSTNWLDFWTRAGDNE